MRRYRKWVFTLGIVAVTPGLAAAAPFAFGQPKDDADASATQVPASKSKNQKVAEDIALALKKASFHGYEIDIEFKDGMATLRGKVSDPRQKARASQIVSQVPGVRRVENKLILLTASSGSIRQVAGSDADLNAGPSQAVHADAIVTNQQKAIEIGKTLQSAGLTGYDIEVMYQNGQALLRGTVATPEQRAAASRVAGSVPGVQAVNNQLHVQGQAAPQGPARPPQYAMTAYQPGQGGPPPGAQMAAGPMGPGAPMGMGAPMPATGPMPNGPVYDNANVPEYAWPSYSQYPNYAAVTYPSQYSASAWPYIGPFYPYPQVPLNWRKVSLEWDDGYWNLKFDSRTEHWWWFMSPKNW
jgi:osmotically-inducible protein OsmY